MLVVLTVLMSTLSVKVRPTRLLIERPVAPLGGLTKLGVGPVRSGAVWWTMSAPPPPSSLLTNARLPIGMMKSMSMTAYGAGEVKGALTEDPTV